jgi:hypothetical protein
MRNATPNTKMVDAVLRATLAATCPARIAAPPMSIDRNRSTIPPFMSGLTLTAVVADPNPAQSSRTPGTT